MSAALIPLAVEALVAIVPLVRDMIARNATGQGPTAEQTAALEAALDRADAAIQAA